MWYEYMIKFTHCALPWLLLLVFYIHDLYHVTCYLWELY